MASLIDPVIVLIGLDAKTIQIIGAYVGHKYQFVVINRNFDITRLASYTNIILFIYDVDQPYLKPMEFIPKLKNNPSYQNIPIIGMALKKHFGTMDPSEKLLFEDILLVPFGNEDLLTRIEIWVRTYEIMSNPSLGTKTYSLDSI